MINCFYREIEFNRDVMDLVENLKKEKHLFFLDSSLSDQERGRFSFIGFDPFDVVSLSGPQAPNELEKKFKMIETLTPCAVTPLAAGIVGLFAYDYAFPEKKIKKVSKDDLMLPDCLFGFYDCVVTIDHAKNKLFITSSGLPETRETKRSKRAQMRLKQLTDKISECLAQKPIKLKTVVSKKVLRKNALRSNFSKASYCRAVKKALDYIASGDIYQVNLSQRYVGTTHSQIEGFDLYNLLRKQSPSSFGGYFNAGKFQVISSSPELFLSLIGQMVQTRPMKGTRPRGKNIKEDVSYRKEILRNKKEKAELLMITDLERNDLGKVCEYGSIKVSHMRVIEEYSTVFQATSTIEGKLQENKNAFDVIKACFPGGSITGCPKLRAMEIIEELEPTRRGVYTGALGYISFANTMAFNILIRTIVKKSDQLCFHVGSGIVSDSVPQSEYEETLVKARAMRECIEKSRN